MAGEGTEERLGRPLISSPQLFLTFPEGRTRGQISASKNFSCCLISPPPREADRRRCLRLCAAHRTFGNSEPKPDWANFLPGASKSGSTTQINLWLEAPTSTLVGQSGDARAMLFCQRAWDAFGLINSRERLYTENYRALFSFTIRIRWRDRVVRRHARGSPGILLWKNVYIYPYVEPPCILQITGPVRATFQVYFTIIRANSFNSEVSKQFERKISSVTNNSLSATTKLPWVNFSSVRSSSEFSTAQVLF